MFLYTGNNVYISQNSKYEKMLFFRNLHLLNFIQKERKNRHIHLTT